MGVDSVKTVLYNGTVLLIKNFSCMMESFESVLQCVGEGSCWSVYKCFTVSLESECPALQKEVLLT